MATDTGIFTQILNVFVHSFSGGYTALLPDAMSLLGVLASLEIAVAAVWWGLTEDDALVELLRKVIKIGLFIFLVTQWHSLSNIVADGFIKSGLKAGGKPGATALIKDPSQIIDYGLAVTQPLMQWYQNLGMGDTLANLPQIMITGWIALLILLAFVVIAGLIILTYVEFYMVSVLCLVLVPFGVFKYTAWIGEKTFSAVISFGVRLMTLSFILAATQPILMNLKFPAGYGQKGFADLGPVIAVLGAAIIILMLAWHAPAVAGGILSGSPALSGGAAAGVGGAVGGAVGGVANRSSSVIQKTGGAAAGAAGKLYNTAKNRLGK